MSRARGAAAMAGGSALSGVLAYVFFALVTRSLGAERAAPVSVLWTYWSFVAAALTFPIQHWIVRTVAAAHGREGGVRRALGGMALTVLLVSLVMSAGSWLLHERLFGVRGELFALLVGAVTVGSALVGVARGMLTARGRLVALGAALVAENLLRCVLAVVLMVLARASPGGWADQALSFGFALAFGQLVGLLWPSALRPGGSAPDSQTQTWWRFLLGAGAGQLLSQVVLTGGPVVLALSGGTPAEVTGLFAALALFRAPYTLALGAISPLTGRLTTMVVQRRWRELQRMSYALLGAGVGLAAVAAGGGAWLGRWLLALIFGDTVVVSLEVVVLTAAGSGLALATLCCTLLAMALGRATLLLQTWVVAAALGGLVVLLAPLPAATATAAGFALAESAALIGLVSQLHRTITQQQQSR